MEHHLTVKSKWHFGKSHLEYLGDAVRNGKLAISEHRVEPETPGNTIFFWGALGYSLSKPSTVNNFKGLS